MTMTTTVQISVATYMTRGVGWTVTPIRIAVSDPGDSSNATSDFLLIDTSTITARARANGGDETPKYYRTRLIGLVYRSSIRMKINYEARLIILMRIPRSATATPTCRSCRTSSCTIRDSSTRG